MGSPAGPFKAAQETALRASAGLMSAMGLGTARIYTEAPPNAVMPYVVIGEDQILLDQSSDCADEAEIISTVHVWSRVSPLDKGVQARAMGSAIIDDGLALTIAGWDVVESDLQSETYVTDPDQSTHGVLVLRYLLTEQVA